MHKVRTHTRSIESLAAPGPLRRSSSALINVAPAVMFVVILVLLATQTAHSAQVTLEWDPIATEGVTGYKLYYGTTSGNYEFTADVGNQTSYTLTGLDDSGSYYFVATAYDANGAESCYSNEVRCSWISSSPGSNGSIAPGGLNLIDGGSSLTFNITPDPYCRIVDVQIDGVSVGAVSSYTFSDVTSSHTISAMFAWTTHTIEAGAAGAGAIYPSGGVPVTHGSQQTFFIEAGAGYTISDVLVDGTSVGAVSSYTFTNVTGPHSISASFNRNNLPPVADAGPNQTVDEGALVTLSGSNSTDPDDGIGWYLWEQTSGAPVVLSDPTAASPTFVAPNVESGGAALTFKLTVTDKGGLDSTATCIVNVTWVNGPPVANAGFDQTVDERTVVTLDGSGSTDSDDGIASYKWEQIAGAVVALSDPTAISPTFTTPDVGVDGQALTFRLTVTDVGGLQANDTCIVNVSWVNTPPVADAGSSWTVNSGDQVTLDGSGSTDADDGIASYRWTQTGGPPVTLSDPTSSKPVFTAPDVSLNGASLDFLLTVTDLGGLTSTSACTVAVAGLPSDLTGTWTSFSYSGGTLQGTLQVRNIGAGPADQFKISVYLSENAVTFTALLKEYTVQSLGAGQSSYLGFTYSSGSALSGKFVIAVYDSGNSVAESRENNNKLYNVVP